MNVFRIEPQKVVGTYKVDFLLTYQGEEWLPRKVRPETHPFHAQLIVECDGHPFHEKTKEQSARDKKRDRVLQELGFKVFHFTGSQVWNDVFGCAQEAVRSLTTERARQTEKSRKA